MKGFKKRLSAMIAMAAIVTSIIPTLNSSATVQNTPVEKQEVKAVEKVGAEGETVDRKVVAYFPEWGYSKEANNYYTVDKMPWDKMTHINYAFAHVDKETNKIAIGDKKAALEMDFPGVTNDFPYKGHFNVLNSYKKKFPNVKTMISVGGWAESTGFFTMATTPEGRETFADSAVDFLREYGFDGLDIDYEYPTAVPESGNPIDFPVADPLRGQLFQDYCKMMDLLRVKLDQASAQDGKKYLLTAAVTASGWVLGGMGRGEYLKNLDFVNLMTYDLHGSWNGYVGHNAALYSDDRDTETKPLGYSYLSTDWAVRYYSGIIDPSKIVVGIPYYTRGWKNVQKSTLPGGLYGEAWLNRTEGQELGDGATGIDNIWHDKINGEEEPGGSNPLWHVKNLLKDKSLGYERFWDDVSKVPYVWNEGKKVFLSFEDEQSMGEKMDYVVNNKLGGIMVWEIDGDFGVDPKTGNYTVGDTLTTIAKEKLDKAGPLNYTPKTNTLPTLNYNVDLVETFDHPFSSFKYNFTNNTGAVIPKGWKLEFDIPNNVMFRENQLSPGSGVTVDKKVVGNNIHITLSSTTNTLKVGQTTLLSGETILKPSSGPKNMVLNGNASSVEWAPKEEIPVIIPPTLTSSTTESVDGKYTLTVKVPDNSKGTTLELYEGSTKIKTEAITSKGQTFTYNIQGKSNGTYDYKAYIKDGKGSANSRLVSVYVGPPINLKAPTVDVSQYINITGGYKVTVDVPEKSDGTTLELYENGTKIKTETLTTAQKTFSYDVTGKSNGAYSYKAVIKNGVKRIESNIMYVTVTNKDTFDPKKVYNTGDIVIYQGATYKCLWWTQTTPPSAGGAWEKIKDAPTGDIVTMATMAQKYNLKTGEAGFEDLYDLNKDGIIDIYDLTLIGRKL